MFNIVTEPHPSLLVSSPSNHDEADLGVKIKTEVGVEEEDAQWSSESCPHYCRTVSQPVSSVATEAATLLFIPFTLF
jgi:hypothetical protein